jgi:predicted Rossmann-fold nucleotide-binding protein
MVEMFDQAVREQFLKPENRKIVLVDDDIEALMAKMTAWVPDGEPKWISTAER